MKIKFFNPESLDKNLKATIHKSGKLGLTIEAANKMELNVQKSISIGIDEENEFDENLYIVVNDHIQKGAFSILKGGDYFYINTKPLFNSLKIDYIKNSVSFDISEEILDGKTLYVFKPRKKERTIK